MRALLNGGDEKALRLRIGEDRKFHHACGIIRALRRAGPEYFDREAIRKTRDDARTIIDLIDRLDETLRSEALAPEIRLRLALEKAPDANTAKAPADRLLIALSDVRELCRAGEENQPSADQVRIWCARIAYSLLDRFSEETPASGSPRSPYRVLAALLYEVLTGDADHDLKRACDEHLRGMRTLQHE
ncbi:hypothetical protein [Bradyrhizobium sp. AZCC 2289]|uniref:hypothetical protein n=1 Tax=Bradyrhizobium sp. AZCC 2289 TaxID=3117026 RepID=UPI002FF34854